MVNLQIRVDAALKDNAQRVAESIGMDLTTAVRVFLRQMVTENGMPFRPVAKTENNDKDKVVDKP